MVNKIILIFLLFILPTKAFCITLGSSIGFNYGILNLKTKEKNIYKYSVNNSKINCGLFYKYNWNIKKKFIGIEFFYDFLNLKNFINNTSIETKRRYGTNLNLGYDITKNFSLYGIIGYGLIKYRIANDKFKDIDIDNNILYGFGVSYNLSISWKVNFEYNRYKLNIDFFNNYEKYKLENNIESAKLSLIYKF